MRPCVRRPPRAGVVVGAQVSYRDLAGFGRRFIDVEPAQLADEVLYQIGALQAFAAAAGTEVGYVKPHGALYNTAVHHEAQAAAVADGVRAFGVLPVLGLPGSALLAAAEAVGLPAVPEAFADRGYTPEGTLVPRRERGRPADRHRRGRRAGRPAGRRRRDRRGRRHRAAQSGQVAVPAR